MDSLSILLLLWIRFFFSFHVCGVTEVLHLVLFLLVFIGDVNSCWFGFLICVDVGSLFYTSVVLEVLLLNAALFCKKMDMAFLYVFTIFLAFLLLSKSPGDNIVDLIKHASHFFYKEDLFTGLYPTSPVPYPGWRIGPSHGVAYGMQYPTTTSVTAFQSPVSSNPFDLANQSAPSYNAMIHPSASLQGPLPNMSNLASLPNSSKLAAVPSRWTPSQQLFHPSSALPGPYMVQQFQYDRTQQLPSNFFPAVNQGTVGGSEPNQGISATNQITAATNSHLSSITSFVPSVGGNPFG